MTTYYTIREVYLLPGSGDGPVTGLRIEKIDDRRFKRRQLVQQDLDEMDAEHRVQWCDRVHNKAILLEEAMRGMFGSFDTYVVTGGNYEKGQVLLALPEDAVSAKDYFH